MRCSCFDVVLQQISPSRTNVRGKEPTCQCLGVKFNLTALLDGNLPLCDRQCLCFYRNVFVYKALLRRKFQLQSVVKPGSRVSPMSIGRTTWDTQRLCRLP